MPTVRILFLLLATACLAQKQVTLTSASGPLTFGPDGIEINNALFTSESVVDLATNQESFVYASASLYWPLGLTHIETGPLVDGDIDSAVFGPGGAISVRGNSFYEGLITLDATFEKARWHRSGTTYRLDAKIIGTLTSALAKCAGEFTVNGRTVVGVAWMQSLTINATECQ